MWDLRLWHRSCNPPVADGSADERRPSDETARPTYLECPRRKAMSTPHFEWIAPWNDLWGSVYRIPDRLSRELGRIGRSGSTFPQACPCPGRRAHDYRAGRAFFLCGRSRGFRRRALRSEGREGIPNPLWRARRRHDQQPRHRAGIVVDNVWTSRIPEHPYSSTNGPPQQLAYPHEDDSHLPSERVSRRQP